MIKTRELVRSFGLGFLGLAVVSIFILQNMHATKQSNLFLCDEITVSKAATTVQASRKAQAAPIEEAILKTSAVPMPIVPPSIVSSYIPEYPADALAKGIEGITVVAAAIGLTGSIDNVWIKTSSGDEQLDSAAVNAVNTWKFNPALQAGQALASVFEVPVRFEIK